MPWNKIVFDIEANNLLTPLLNFSKMPYELKEEARVWCTVLRDVETRKAVLLLPEEYLNYVAPISITKHFATIEVQYYEIEDDPSSPLITGTEEVLLYSEYFSVDQDGNLILQDTVHSKFYKSNIETKAYNEVLEEGLLFNSLPKRILSKETLARIFQNCEELIGHNIINYDLPMMKLYGLLDYEIGWPGQDSLLNGKPCLITDTLVWSKLLNPDRQDSFGKHGLAAWGLRLGFPKWDFHEFDQWSWRMCAYCFNDTLVSVELYEALINEANQDKTDWKTAYGMEAKLVDLTLKQEIFGFHFNKDLANWCVEDLTQKLKERADIVEPSLPRKPLNKGQLKEYTPPTKQLLKNGELNSFIQKFALKHDAEIVKQTREDDESAFDYYFKYEDKQYKIPFTEALVDSLPTNIKDNDHVKGYLLSLGWDPSEWTERDLTKNSKKQTLDVSKIIAAIKRYAASTAGSHYEKYRLDFVGCNDISKLEEFLLKKYHNNPRKGLKVYTSPKLRVGAEKTICPNLDKIDTNKDFVQAIVEWHTYTHRKNSISGGVDEETGEPTKGYLSQCREEDGRIPTPADTLGASTFRYRHIGVKVNTLQQFTSLN